MVPALYRIHRVKRETVDTFTLSLVSESNRRLAFEPGQFNMLSVFGHGEVAISISGDPDGVGEMLVHTVRAVGAVTNILTGLKAGKIVGVRGPYGRAWPVDQAVGRDIVVVAGGIGLAPLRPAMYRLLAHRTDFGRVVLLYGARTPEDLIYRDQLEEWRGRLDVQVDVTVDAAGGTWRGNVGVVTTMFENARFDPDDSIVMACGPEIMMRFAVLEMQKLGVPTQNIFLSMERGMHCGIGHCGHCQFGPDFICKDGPVFPYEHIAPLLQVREA